MEIVATTSLPAVDRPNADRWNAARSCQKRNFIGWGVNPPSIGKRPIYFGFFLFKASLLSFPSSSKKNVWLQQTWNKIANPCFSLSWVLSSSAPTYSNLENIIEVEFQEAMQNVRKSKTIQQDKLRSLATCFLANILQDYYHNLAKHKVFISMKIIIYCQKPNLASSPPQPNFLEGVYDAAGCHSTWLDCIWWQQFLGARAPL